MKKAIILVSVLILIGCTKEEKPIVQNAEAPLPYINAEIWGTAKEGGHAIELYTTSNYPIYNHVIFRKAKQEQFFQVVHYDTQDYPMASYWFPCKDNKKYEYYGYAQLLFPQFYSFTDTISLPK